LIWNGEAATGYGVQTGASSIASWRADSGGITLILDLRCGGSDVLLGDRELLAATIIINEIAGKSPFAAAQDFCRSLCPSPKLPERPIYGGNNWYYAYGQSSHDEILADSRLISSLSPKGSNRPFMVIDDGWQPNPVAGPWREGNVRFPDMPGLAAEMTAIGVDPGIWVRPLYTREAIDDTMRLQAPHAKRETSGAMLDPTVPAVQELITEDLRRVAGWGFGMVKHDFSTYDLTGRWGFQMTSDLTNDGWRFADVSKTTAEVIVDLYRTIRDAIPGAVIIGCNTVGHLAAGLFELQRTGDDTSGREWARTRKMGVNTLAFRMPQHDTFFAVDADCVGLTTDIPWALNAQWLDLLARSGTPLFVSAAAEAVGPEQRAALEAAFARAAEPHAVAEPLDWMENTSPRRWLIDGNTVEYNWFDDDQIISAVK